MRLRKKRSPNPLASYPIPYKKDLPFVIIGLMEEVEKEVRPSLVQGVSQYRLCQPDRKPWDRLPQSAPVSTVDKPFLWGPVISQSEGYTFFLLGFYVLGLFFVIQSSAQTNL